MPVFERTVVSRFASFMSMDQPTALQFISVCIIDDAIEFGGASSLRYIPQVLPFLICNLGSEDLGLQQSSTYGIAQVRVSISRLPFLVITAPNLWSKPDLATGSTACHRGAS